MKTMSFSQCLRFWSLSYGFNLIRISRNFL